jgi:hypothetical protein
VDSDQPVALARSCALTARELGAGTYHLSAVYAATGDFTASTSAAKTLVVARA